jgi:DNA polymerase-3 subunit alpha
MEKEILGVYVSGHPLDPFKKKFESAKANIQMIHKDEIRNEQKAIIGGIIEQVKEITTKKGDKMAFLTIADFTSSIEAVVFPKTYKKNIETIAEDNIVAMQVTVSDRDGQKSVIVNGIKKLTEEKT